MPEPLGFNPASVNLTTTGPYYVGELREYLGKTYRFVLNANDAAIADGVVCVWASAVAPTITGASRATALLGATTLGSPCAGVGIGLISQQRYGFIQVFGLHTNVLGVATTTIGRKLRASATADSADNVSNAYDSSFGEAVSALGAVTAGRVSVHVRCL